MGGAAKGLLRAPDTRDTILGRLVNLVSAMNLSPVLVGRCDASRAALPAVPWLDDEPGLEGPMAGLAALLDAAHRAGAPAAFALACDLPFVDDRILGRLRDADPTALAVAPRRTNGVWEPLCARYSPSLALHAMTGEFRSPRALLDAVGALPVHLSDDEWGALVDWDTPEEIGRRDETEQR
jgi:molybdopterin-guanine dinucleotide biosynthesis protein A